ncbi:hypothetical protein DIPPA_63291, partial [Diplonema papillatum]
MAAAAVLAELIADDGEECPELLEGLDEEEQNDRFDSALRGFVKRVASPPPSPKEEKLTIDEEFNLHLLRLTEDAEDHLTHLPQPTPPRRRASSDGHTLQHVHFQKLTPVPGANTSAYSKSTAPCHHPNNVTFSSPPHLQQPSLHKTFGNGKPHQPPKLKESRQMSNSSFFTTVSLQSSSDGLLSHTATPLNDHSESRFSHGAAGMGVNNEAAPAVGRTASHNALSPPSASLPVARAASSPEAMIPAPNARFRTRAFAIPPESHPSLVLPPSLPAAGLPQTQSQPQQQPQQQPPQPQQQSPQPQQQSPQPQQQSPQPQQQSPQPQQQS